MTDEEILSNAGFTPAQIHVFQSTKEAIEKRNAPLIAQLEACQRLNSDDFALTINASRFP
jgi:hypothetical protein